MYDEPRFGSAPLMVKLATEPKHAAGTRSGNACAKHPNTASTTRNVTSADEPETARGNWALRKVPSGTIRDTGRKMKELIGTSGKICFRAAKTAANVAENDALREPFKPLVL